LADVVSSTTEPALGAIRLAWWRERLVELDEGAVPAEPRLRAIVRQLLGRGITGAELSQLEDAWLPLLAPFPWEKDVAEGLRLRGRILFGLGARLLGGDPGLAEAPGELWSLIDGVQHCSDQGSRTELLKAASSTTIGRVPGKLRPLTILTALAVASVRDRSSGIARGMAAVHHRLTGRILRL
jgi:phytoene synthase